jgi:hypothetical protein
MIYAGRFIPYRDRWTDNRSIWPVKPRAGGGKPRTKEFDFGPLRLELVRQAV